MSIFILKAWNNVTFRSIWMIRSCHICIIESITLLIFILLFTKCTSVTMPVHIWGGYMVTGQLVYKKRSHIVGGSGVQVSSELGRVSHWCVGSVGHAIIVQVPACAPSKGSRTAREQETGNVVEIENVMNDARTVGKSTRGMAEENQGKRKGPTKRCRRGSGCQTAEVTGSHCGNYDERSRREGCPLESPVVFMD